MKKSIITSITALLCTMLTACASWEITSTSGSTFEVTDGTWVLKCQTTDSNGSFKITSVISGEDAALDLIALNSDIDTADVDYSLTEITSSLRNKSISGLTIPKTLEI